MVPVGGDDLAYGGGVVCPAPVDEDEGGIVRDGVKGSLHTGCIRVLRHQIFRGGIGGVAGGIFFGFHECMMGACRENYGKKNDNDSGKKVFKTHHKDSFELIGLFFAFYINREQKECKGVVTT